MARALTRFTRNLAEQFGLVFYPFFLDGVAGQRTLNLPDGIHPNREGNCRDCRQYSATASNAYWHKLNNEMRRASYGIS